MVNATTLPTRFPPTIRTHASWPRPICDSTTVNIANANSTMRKPNATASRSLGSRAAPWIAHTTTTPYATLSTKCRTVKRGMPPSTRKVRNGWPATAPAPRLEEVGEEQHPPHVVPPRIAYAMIAHRIKHAGVGLAVGGGAIGGRGTVRRPSAEPRVPQRVVQPRRPEPAAALALRHGHLLRPLLQHRHDSPDMRPPSLPHLRPRRQLCGRRRAPRAAPGGGQARQHVPGTTNEVRNKPAGRGNGNITAPL